MPYAKKYYISHKNISLLRNLFNVFNRKILEARWLFSNFPGIMAWAIMTKFLARHILKTCDYICYLFKYQTFFRKVGFSFA